MNSLIALSECHFEITTLPRMLNTHVEMELDDVLGSKKKKGGQIRCSLPSFVRISET